MEFYLLDATEASYCEGCFINCVRRAFVGTTFTPVNICKLKGVPLILYGAAMPSSNTDNKLMNSTILAHHLHDYSYTIA